MKLLAAASMLAVLLTQGCGGGNLLENDHKALVQFYKAVLELDAKITKGSTYSGRTPWSIEAESTACNPTLLPAVRSKEGKALRQTIVKWRETLMKLNE